MIYFSRTSSGSSGGGGESSDSNEIIFSISQITTSTIKIKTSTAVSFSLSVTIRISDEADASGHYAFVLEYNVGAYTSEKTFNYTVSDIYKKYMILSVHPTQVTNNGKPYNLKYSESACPVIR